MISMLKMIIIEDEKLEREGLVDFFDWNSMGIQIVGTACDGIEGIELALKTKPDIIITDIKMPGMNGLDMSKKIKEILPQTKIIILTGYGDFNFAKQAIGISVSAYILKPIEEDELMNCIKKIVLECTKNETMKLILNKENYSKKIKFFRDLLQGKLEIEDFKKDTLYFGFNDSVEAKFAIIAIRFKEMGEKLFQRITLEMENMIDKNICFLVPYVEKKIIFICLRVVDKRDIMLEDSYKQIIKYIELEEPLFFMGIGTIVENIYDIKESVDAAIKALDYGLFWFESGVFNYKDIAYNKEHNNGQVSNFIVVGNTFAKQLVHAVGCLDDGSLKKILKELFEFISESKSVDREYICNYLYNVIYEVSLILYSLDKNNQKGINDKKSDFVTPMLKLKNVKLLYEYMYNFFEKVIEIRDEKRNCKDEDIIKSVIKLIKEGYMMGISLKIISAQVYLSPNYLGHIFRKYMGKSFNDYLCAYRMEKAKELLKDSNKKISSVSAEIGIPNTSYFCNLFKNIYGMAPKEYQEMILRD